MHWWHDAVRIITECGNLFWYSIMLSIFEAGSLLQAWFASYIAIDWETQKQVCLYSERLPSFVLLRWKINARKFKPIIVVAMYDLHGEISVWLLWCQRLMTISIVFFCTFNAVCVMGLETWQKKQMGWFLIYTIGLVAHCYPFLSHKVQLANIAKHTHGNSFSTDFPRFN